MKQRDKQVGFLSILILCAITATAQSVRDITLRQRYPWSDRVDIDYTVEGVRETRGLYIRFEIEEKESGKRYIDIPTEEEGTVSNGTHRVVWLPGKSGIADSLGRFHSDSVVCRAHLRRDDPQRYLTIDLSAGKEAASYPVSYSPALPPEGLTDTYRTDKLILKKIDPGQFVMGMRSNAIGFRSNEDFRPHPVTLTRGFYIGIFEVTQRQWERVTGTHPSRDNKGGADSVRGETRPVHTLSYDMIRGNDLGRRWPASSEVDPDSFIGKLREKTGLEWLDLPTEAQWEYAGRAGTTTTLNNGKSLTDEVKCRNLTEIARYGHNQKDGKSPFGTLTARVGSYLPNRWGLYDFHGNVFEYCLDYWSAPQNNPTARIDPAGAGSDSQNRRVCRSSGPGYNAFRMKIGDRIKMPSSDSGWDSGFRLSGTLPR